MANVAKMYSIGLVKDNTAKISNAELKRREEAEKALKVAKNKLKPPKWLGEIATAEFKYIVKQTQSIELLTNLDVHVLAVYCNVYERYVECSNKITEDGIVLGEDDAITAHPLFVKQHQLFQQMRAMQNDLGLSPTARAKIALHSQPKEDVKKGGFDV